MQNKSSFVGRQREATQMLDLLENNRSDMLAVLGRRRVGKTELIRQVYSGKIDFEITGIQHANTAMQLQNFADKFNECIKPEIPVKRPANWQEAFTWLKKWMMGRKNKRKVVLFFDELPWLATPRSMFLEMFGHFWNDCASKYNALIVICGSAAGWMIKNVVRNKGSLHNRITLQIHLKPFTLAETEAYLLTKGIQLGRHDIIQLYMVTGGIPHYLSPLKKGKSIAEYISQLCFEPNGVLTDEFEKLFASLYDKPENYTAVIRALATKWKGLTRKELVEVANLSDGGTVTKILFDLETADFITTVWPFDKKKKEALYRLTDPYSLFYVKFMEEKRKRTSDGFLKIHGTAAWKNWTGYAFENICLAHIPQIMESMGIGALYTEVSSYLYKGNATDKGFQIDLLIDRADNILHICEVKYHDGPVTITKAMEENLRLMRSLFRERTGTRKNIYLTLISTFGTVANNHQTVFETMVKQDALFLP